MSMSMNMIKKYKNISMANDIRMSSAKSMSSTITKMRNIITTILTYTSLSRRRNMIVIINMIKKCK